MPRRDSNQRTGLLDGSRIWAYAPGHMWEARQLAEAEAARRGLQLTGGGQSLLIECAPMGKPMGRYEVWVFEVVAVV